MSSPFLRKIRKLIIHPKQYFIDYFKKQLNINTLNNEIKEIHKRISEIKRIMDILTVYTNHKGLQRGDLFIYANQEKIFPDDYIKAFCDKFYRYRGYFPNLKNPQTFNDKINWLKFNYFNPNERICSDKSKAKQYFIDKIGHEHVIPLLGIYDNVSEINFDELPEQVVFKNTASGAGSGVRILRNKSTEDLDKLKFELNALLFDWAKTTFLGSFNPKIHDIKMRLIAEEYIEQVYGRVYDYKFFCFHGEAKFFYIKIPVPGLKNFWSIYDLEFRRTPFQFLGRPLPETDPTPPHNFSQMIEISNKISQEFPFARVDLYSIGSKIFVGEITFAPDGGFLPIDYKYDIEIASLLDLDKIDEKYIGHWENGYKFIYKK